jgi:hypothetical protein
MRIAVVVFAALITFGLVAFGAVLTQKATDPAGVSSSKNTLSAKSDKASPSTGRGCEGHGILCIDRSRAERHNGGRVGFSSSRADAEARS